MKPFGDVGAADALGNALTTKMTGRMRFQINEVFRPAALLMNDIDI